MNKRKPKLSYVPFTKSIHKHKDRERLKMKGGKEIRKVNVSNKCTCGHHGHMILLPVAVRFLSLAHFKGTSTYNKIP